MFPGCSAELYSSQETEHETVSASESMKTEARIFYRKGRGGNTMTARLAQRHIYATQAFETTRMGIASSFGRSCTLFLEEMTDGLEQ